MSGRRIVFALVIVLFSQMISTNAYCYHISSVHSSTVMALAPSIVSFETGLLSSIENPSLSSSNRFTGLFYQYSTDNYNKLNIISLKSYYKALSFSLTAYDALSIGETEQKALSFNLSATIGTNIMFGANFNHFTYEYLSYETKYPYMNVDLGIYSERKISEGKFDNEIMTGFVGILDKDRLVSLRGGVANRISDRDKTIPAFDRLTIFVEDAARFFEYEEIPEFTMNYMTVGGEVCLFEKLFIRAGYTNAMLLLYSDSDEDNAWTLNYGIGYTLTYDKLIFAENPLMIAINAGKIPKHMNFAWWTKPASTEIVGFSLSLELAAKFSIIGR